MANWSLKDYETVDERIHVSTGITREAVSKHNYSTMTGSTVKLAGLYEPRCTRQTARTPPAWGTPSN